MVLLYALLAVLMLPPDAPPRIVATHLSAQVVRPGDLVSGSVETSSNVASVVARVGSYVQPLERTSVGNFRVAMRVPRVPFFMRGHWTLSFIAKNTAGVQVVTSMPITLR